MNFLKSKRWTVIAIGLLGASTNALACVVTPDSILTEGQTLQLVADCSDGVGGALGSVKVGTINWQMATSETGAASSITGDIALNQTSPKKIYYTIPAELTSSGAGEYWFSVIGRSVGLAANALDDLSTADKAKVVIKSANAVLSVANTVNPAVNGTCGTPPGAAVQSMPTGLDQCDPGKPALAISGPQSFTWSCLGLNGGAEANCYALRGYTVSATVGANGSLVGISPVGGGVAAGGTATITVLPALNYSASFSSPCGGTPAGNSFTTGPVNSNCNVTVSFSDTPVYGACGTASNATPVELAPSANLCTVTGGTPTQVVDTAVANRWTWGCNGTPNGSSTTATACQAPKGYMVTTSAGPNGTISASKVVQGGTTTNFTVSPNAGYMVQSVSGCGGTLSGGTYTTGAINGVCQVSATFSVLTVSTTDPGIGAGLWVPPNMPNRTVADQTGTEGLKISYVPGCLNGLTAVNSSSGCSAMSSYTGTIAGTTTSRTVTLGSGNQLVLRYKSTPTAGSTVKYMQVLGGDGSNVGVNMRVWLSSNPSATYATVDSKCKQTTTIRPAVITGPNYCAISPNTTYYFGIEFDEAITTRFQVYELGADFL
jgi:hypothetical protein